MTTATTFPIPIATNTKSSGPSSSEVTTGAITKRLTSELMTLMMSTSPGISAFPANDDDMTRWVGKITGPDETIYADLTFKISLTFPQDYPFRAPLIKFETPCYHPNFDLAGNICLDILKEKWSAVLSVQSILLSLQSLFGEPNNASPLNPEAADLWNNPAAFKVELLRHYKPIGDDE